MLATRLDESNHYEKSIIFQKQKESTSCVCVCPSNFFSWRTIGTKWTFKLLRQRLPLFGLDWCLLCSLAHCLFCWYCKTIAAYLRRSWTWCKRKNGTGEPDERARGYARYLTFCLNLHSSTSRRGRRPKLDRIEPPYPLSKKCCRRYINQEAVGLII